MLYILMKKMTRNSLPKIFLSPGSCIKYFYYLLPPSLFKSTSFQSGSLWSLLGASKQEQVRKEVSPAGSPPAGILSPRWALFGPRMAPHHSPSFPLPDRIAQPTAARTCRAEGLVLPAKGRSPRITALWSVVERVVENWTVPAWLHDADACMLVCVFLYVGM